MTSVLLGKDVLSTKGIPREILDDVMDEADHLAHELELKGILHVLKSKVLCTVFLEPSTRTRLSFQFAMIKMGGRVVDFGAPEISSVAKGESFEDTMRMIDGYRPHVIVLRSKTVGAAEIAARICDSPVINAGDGSNEHPTQAMIDLYTVKRVRGSIDGVRIGLMGDLAHSRTTNSLSFALDKYKGVTITFIAPPELQVSSEVSESLRNTKKIFGNDVKDVIESLDFLYVTRLQKERFANLADYERLRGSYQLSKAGFAGVKKVPFIMHPLPRVDELAPDLDELPQAKYFEQAKNGVFVRAALIERIVGRGDD